MRAFHISRICTDDSNGCTFGKYSENKDIKKDFFETII